MLFILKQRVGRGGIQNNLVDVFQEGKTEFGSRGLRLADLIRMLKIAITSLPYVFIYAHALNEFLQQRLPEPFESLRDIVLECPTGRIFLRGRPHITEDIQTYFSKAVVIPITPNTDNIRNYLEMRFEGNPELVAMSNDLWADIVRPIPENISNICVKLFRIPALSMIYT